MNPHQVTKDFERAIGEYTGAPHVVAVNSCTMAILLAVAWWKHVGCWRWENGQPNKHGVVIGERGMNVEIPKRTYVSVPMAIIHAGGRPAFREQDWRGGYRLEPLPVWDFARWFTYGMYSGIAVREREGLPLRENMAGQMLCVSFHASKTLGIEQGGAILLDDPEADAWLRRARFDGRTEGVPPNQDTFKQIGWHCYLNPSTAAQGLLKLHSLAQYNDPLPNDDYPELDKMEIFK